jgi:hypothetical protein
MMSTIQQRIANMMVTNTGAHFLDSGSAYGRDHERNRAEVGEADPVDVFGARPPISVDRWGLVTLDVFHWLTERLDVLDEDPDTNDGRLLAAWNTAVEDDTVDPWSPSDIERWAKEIGGTDIGGCNTYNGECALSQTLQWTEFSLDGVWGRGQRYVLLQVHQGADVRGGYTAAELYRVEVDYLGSDVAQYYVTLEIPNANYRQCDLTADDPATANEHSYWRYNAMIANCEIQDVSVEPWRADGAPDIDMQELLSEDSFTDREYVRIGPDTVEVPGVGTLYYTEPIAD